MIIDFAEYDRRGRWSVRPEGASEDAEMTFSRVSDHLIMIDHTYVPDEARGQHVGQELALRAIADAREHGWSIIPVCPFFKAQALRHPEWGDVVKG